MAVVDMGIELYDLAENQSGWSQATFGTDEERGPTGALRHLAKEAAEAEEAVASGDSAKVKEELADCFLLILDAARRAGVKPLGLIRAAQKKMAINRQRTWPRPVDDMPVEHVRTSIVASRLNEMRQALIDIFAMSPDETDEGLINEVVMLNRHHESHHAADIANAADMENLRDGAVTASNRIAELEAELRDIGKLAAAHHSDQPSHVLLHALTVDIPDRVGKALARGPQSGCKPTRFDRVSVPPEHGDWIVPE